MKKLLLLCALWCSACTIPDQAFKQAQGNANLCDAFVLSMEAGLTSREQEQNFIRANRRAWHAQNFAINDVPLPPDVQAWEIRRRADIASNTSTSLGNQR